METYAGSILGFRCWSVDSETNSLGPAAIKVDAEGHKIFWDRGSNTAKCVHHPVENIEPAVGDAPHSEDDHHCGFNAWFDPHDARRYSLLYSDSVYGAIAGSGKMCFHTKGFRSEQAQIIALYIPLSSASEEATILAADAYGVPFFYSEKEFLCFAKQQASYMPSLKGKLEVSEDYNRSWMSLVWPEDSIDDEPSRILEDGTQEWYQDGLLHREGDRPARVLANGTQEWYRRGEPHRDGDRPAFIWANGALEWCIDGKTHREGDQPARIGADGEKQWYRGGELHREGDKPAVVLFNGDQEWWKNDCRHREGDLPAVVRVDGSRSWWYEGRMRRAGDLPALISEADQTMAWYNESGRLHRDGDLPAFIEGRRVEYYVDGLLHRDGDRPARLVFYESQYGRTDDYTEEEEAEAQTREWYQGGSVHREGDKPAFLSKTVKAWQLNGILHREDNKPALIDSTTGRSEYWVEGKLIRVENHEENKSEPTVSNG